MMGLVDVCMCLKCVGCVCVCDTAHFSVGLFYFSRTEKMSFLTALSLNSSYFDSVWVLFTLMLLGVSSLGLDLNVRTGELVAPVVRTEVNVMI